MMKPTMLKSTWPVSSTMLEQRVGFAADRVQREAEQHGEQQRLQHIPARKGAEEGRGDDVEDELGDPGQAAGGGVLGDGMCIERRRIRVHARARASRHLRSRVR